MQSTVQCARGLTSRMAGLSLSESLSAMQQARIIGISGLSACILGYHDVRTLSSVAGRLGSKHTTTASLSLMTASSALASSGFADVSVNSIGTRSGVKSSGSFVGGRVGTGRESNVSFAAAKKGRGKLM